MTALHNIRNQQDIAACRRRLQRQITKKETVLRSDITEIKSHWSLTHLFAAGTSHIVQHVGSNLNLFLTGISLVRRLLRRR